MYKTANNSASENTRSDLYSRVTSEIVKAIERGAGKYEMPWNSLQSNLLPLNGVTGKNYRGINILSLEESPSLLGSLRTGGRVHML